MKLALAIVCSFLLAGVPLLRGLSAPMPASCARQALACCQHGHVMPCCAAKSAPDSQPAPVVAQTGGQNTLSFLASNLLTWTLPANPAHSIVPFSASLSPASDAPLYARNCARLI